jgi:hypothetical protein
VLAFDRSYIALKNNLVPFRLCAALLPSVLVAAQILCILEIVRPPEQLSDIYLIALQGGATTNICSDSRVQENLQNGTLYSAGTASAFGFLKGDLDAWLA